jgi:hypothetical protein
MEKTTKYMMINIYSLQSGHSHFQYVNLHKECVTLKIPYMNGKDLILLLLGELTESSQEHASYTGASLQKIKRLGTCNASGTEGEENVH